MEKITGKITAVTKEPKEFNGKLTLGFMVNDIWYNASGTKETLEETKKTHLVKGNEVEFEVENGLPVNLKVTKEAPKESDDDMVNLDALLSQAHKSFGKNLEIKTKMISVDYEKKRALFKARVIIMAKDQEQHFEGHGDADQENCAEMVKKHYIRMAESRSIVRALRFATNNAKVAEEELDQ